MQALGAYTIKLFYYGNLYTQHIKTVCLKLSGWQQDTQHNDNQHNDIQHTDTQHKELK